MLISFFDHSRDSKPKIENLDWEQFIARLGTHQFIYPEKTRCPMFSPAEFRPGKARKKENVLRIWSWVMDSDGITTAQLFALTRKLEIFDSLIYTTWRHPEVAERGLWKIRIVVRLTRPIEVTEWSDFWARATAYFLNLNDFQCTDANRCYFVPAAPVGTERQAVFVRFRGAALDPDNLALLEPVQVPVKPIARDRLERVAQRWRRARDLYRSEMGEILLKVCRGEAFAEHGDRDVTAFQLMADLAKEFPTADPNSIAAHFQQSLQVMPGTRLTVEEIAEKFSRVAQETYQDQLESTLLDEQDSKLRIRAAFAAIDPTRDYPYTTEEINALAAQCGCSIAELGRRWIIQRKNIYYLLGPEGYSKAYSIEDVTTAILRDLAPAITAGVNPFVVTKKGQLLKPFPTIMREYGTVATSHVLDLRAQQSKYLPAEKLFIEAPTPLRKLEPTFDPQVAEWLRIMFAEHHENVLNWLAQVTNLNITAAALLLIGKKGVGKGTFVNGLSRLYSITGPTKLIKAMGDFNDSITRNPIIFADEQFPKDFRGRTRTAELREFISDHSRHYNKKHQPESTILGTIRLVAAANNEEIMAIPDHLTLYDIEAIADRIYHVAVNSAAADYLSTIDVSRFVAGDAIAKHVLWLRDNFPTWQDGRFLIRPMNPEFYLGLTTRSGIRSNVLQWLAGYVRMPGRLDAIGTYQVFVRNQKLCIRAEALLDHWSLYVNNVPTPTLGSLAGTVRDLSTRRSNLDKPNGCGRANYNILDTRHLYAWADQTEYLSKEEIDNVLAVDTEVRISLDKSNVRQN